MAGDTVVRHYDDGTTVFSEGDPGDGMYVVLGGKVRIHRALNGREVTLAVLGQGEFFGEMSLLDHRPRSATAEAVGDTELRFISILEFEAMIPDPYIRRMLVRMSERMRQADETIAKLQNESDARYSYASGLNTHREWVL